MKYQELLVLLPCHSLEDFPLHHEGEEAQGLLANWTALWHPAFLASAGAMPQWRRVEDPPVEVANRLILVPSVSAEQLPTAFAQRVTEEQGLLILRKTDRAEIIAAGLQPLDGGDGGLSQELAADFLALGFCYLQVQLLTRQMRYSSNLDEIHFERQVVAGAVAAMQGETELAREKVAACFDILAEERDHYYPVDAFLLDLTLVAETTIGQSLRDELAAGTPINLWLPAQVLQQMAEQEPATLQAIRQALAEQRLGLIGGEAHEGRPALVSCESLLKSLKLGVSAYRDRLDYPLAVYGRRRFGLTSILPQVLRKLGFEGALHFTLDEGGFPEGSQIKIQWEGDDGTLLDALARSPLDAAKPESFLGYAVKLGESMDMDHVATVCLAHWPGQTSPWHDDLRRVASFCSALGKPVTIEQLFRETDSPGHQDHFEDDQYRSPYLRQSVLRRMDDPISTSVRYWRRHTAAQAARNMQTLAQLIRGEALPLTPPPDSRIDELSEEGDDSQLDDQLRSCLDESAQALIDAIPLQQAAAEDAYLVVNPFSFVRRLGLDSSQLGGPADPRRPVYSSSRQDERLFTVVDAPPMGFARIVASDGPSASKRKSLLLAEEGLLRNEHMQAVIDPETGGLRALYDYSSRSNRLGQQLVFRDQSSSQAKSDQWRDPEEEALFSAMQADEVHVTLASETVGEIVSRGKLVASDGSALAEFQQTFRLWRGSRVLQMQIELQPRHAPKADPWRSYFACRWAWADESAELWRTIQETRQLVRSQRFESPLCLEIDSGAGRTALLTGGLPYHRRFRHSMLDSLLIVRGERATQFCLGIGVDVKNPLQDALSLIAPDTCRFLKAAPPTPENSSWLFHIDHRNVLATHWEILTENGQLVGFRVRLRETQGRAARGKLSAFLPIQSAQTVDFQDASLGDCRLEDGAVRFELAAHEWSELKVRTAAQPPPLQDGGEKQGEHQTTPADA